MGISYDHSQYLTDIRQALGESSAEIKHVAPFTDMEFYRTLVDPGFAGSIAFIEGDLFFEGGTTVIQNVTWKWQAREQGASTWVDLHTAVTEQWTGGTATGIRVGLDAAALGTGADSVPLEVRIIITAATAATVSMLMGSTGEVPAVRVFGEVT